MKTAAGTDLPGKDLIGESNHLITVSLGKICDGANEPRTGPAHLGTSLQRAILAHDGAVRTASALLKRSNGTECHWVIPRKHDRAPRRCVTEISTNLFERGFHCPPSINLDGWYGLHSRQQFAKSCEHSGHSKLDQRTGSFLFHEQNVFGFSFPVLLYPSSDGAASDNACLVVIGPEERRARMRNFDRNHGNSDLYEPSRDQRSDSFMILELNHKIDAFTNQCFCVSQCTSGTSTAVDRNQIHPCFFSSTMHAFGDRTRERSIHASTRKTDSVSTGGGHPDSGAKVLVTHALDQTFLFERSEQPRRRRFMQTGADDQFAQPEFLPFCLEAFEDLARSPN